MHFTPRHTATILAALRIYQEEITNFGWDAVADREQFTSTGHAPFTLQEIDTLCETLNFEAPDPLLTHLAEELEAIRQALQQDNPGRADWLARKATERITAHQAPAKPAETEDLKARRLAIIDLADEQHASEDIDVDADARLSEGDDNGCYVSAWLWVNFSGTPFDKEPEEEEEDQDELPECTACTDGSCPWCQAEIQASSIVGK